MQIKYTNQMPLQAIKMLVYGQAGAGKTSLIPTLPKPLILSAEAGLLSIASADLPYVEIKSIDDLRNAYTWIIKEGSDFESIALDSISEIAEVVLNHELKTNKDPRKAYGEMQTQMADIVRAFRDLPQKHVYFTCKVEKTLDEMGRMLYAPSMPGNKMGQLIPYFFDEVLALRVERDSEGNVHRTLQTQPDGLWQAKDRSGKLEPFEDCDLTNIINKIGE